MIAAPSDEILLKYTAGTLDPALRLLVQRHIELSPQTAERLRDFTSFGGVLLAAQPPMPMTGGSLDRALARIGTQVLPEVDDDWPDLDRVRWRWAGPGRVIAPITIEGSSMKSFVLRIAPGKSMLQHSHAGREWTLILQGTFRDDGGEYGRGAFLDEDQETVHTPISTGEVDCICLAVLSGPLKAPGIMGHLANWLLR